MTTTEKATNLLLSPPVMIFILTSLFGGMVWGIQLNTVTLALVQEVSRNSAKVDEHELVLARALVVLDKLEHRLGETNTYVIDNGKEAETWRRRIMLNENKIEQLDRGG